MGCNSSNETSKRELLCKVEFGPYILNNRIMMSAMTRLRADPQTGVPNDVHVKYYSERAEDAGIVVTEATAVSQGAETFPGATQMFNNEHLKGWKKVVEAVHNVKGKIFCQLYHAGRSTNCEKTRGVKVVSCSTIKNRHEGQSKNDEPIELDKKGIKEVIDQFACAAKLCKEAGFDGIELNGHAGYIIDNFLRDCTNNRKDEYGGSPLNRCRFLLEIIDEVAKIFGSQRIGLKIGPCGRYNDMYDSDPKALLEALLPELNKRKICYVTICRPPDVEEHLYDKSGLEQIPHIYDGLKKLLPKVLLVGNSGFSPEESSKMIKENIIDLVAFGKFYIANPDLSNRIKNNFELSQPDWSSVYGGGEKGYSDYPKYTPKN